MIRAALLLALASASPLAAQIPNLWEGEAMLGLAGRTRAGQNGVPGSDHERLALRRHKKLS
jgi:hypothetical protein